MNQVEKEALRRKLRGMHIDELREMKHEVEQVIQEKRGIVSR